MKRVPWLVLGGVRLPAVGRRKSGRAPTTSGWSTLLLFFPLLLFLLPPTFAKGQALRDTSLEDLQHVMPGADRFSDREGDPPVYRAYRTESGEEALVGYVFRTSDIPPEVRGYDAPIDVLVGLDREGTVTGARIVRHVESLRRTRGDFFQARGFQAQFSGKHITDPFNLRQDVHNISGATISVDAMARGVRNAARRVAVAYLLESEVGEGERSVSLRLEELQGLSWMDLVNHGAVQTLAVVERGLTRFELSFAYIWRDEVGEIILGPELYAEALEELGDRAQEGHRFLLGIEGSTARWSPLLLFLIQDADTFSVGTSDVALFNSPEGGVVTGELRAAGVVVFDEALDVARPFTIAFGGALALDVFTTEYPGRPRAEALVADGEGAGPGLAEAPEPREGSGAAPTGTAEEPVEPGDDVIAVEGEEEVVAAPPIAPGETAEGSDPLHPSQEATLFLPGLEFVEVEEQSQLARTLARTSWGRVGALLLLLAVVTAAFAAKSTALRWVALTGTVGFLGWADGGFLSVSHITSAIAVGPAVYLNDLSLLILVVFTVVTTLVWGRVFCGYLCPFGALQDFVERVVPKRFKRDLPHWVHDRALRLKYLILLIVLTPVVMFVLTPTFIGERVSLHQYFEPFGTVFFLSPSVLLWSIAFGILVLSAVVPRFYCRYLCPLGAALAVVSRISPLRIRRVEQCSMCKICEQSCPTRAIRGPEIDFPECVRCSVCEVKLLQGAGACRHEMDAIRPRLVQLRASSEWR